MITTPGPVDLTANQMNPTGAPFALRLFGQWLHLEGIAPGVGVTNGRAVSRMVSVDGVAWDQRAPRGPRSWDVQWEWATKRSVTALTLAADFPDDVWLLDRAAAVANMLDNRACLGTGAVLLAGGTPLPRLTANRVATTMVRGGVATFAALWSTEPAGTVVGAVSWPGGDAQLVAPGGTAAQRAEVAFTPDADGPVTLTAFAGTTGLQVTEDWLPEEWMAGQRTPCRVSVSDPAENLHRMSAGEQALADYSVTLREVG
ncbi:hypothetical protein [Nocardioides alkalitolerans]|uniref:hypothetical protein n=1 Tax=Nocardioides alkalitolerans TaxID=281714 RepID=UPI00040389D8|nr:hypothetical protein [Nocardioides alkalitolerans]